MHALKKLWDSPASVISYRHSPSVALLAVLEFVYLYTPLLCHCLLLWGFD